MSRARQRIPGNTTILWLALYLSLILLVVVGMSSRPELIYAAVFAGVLLGLFVFLPNSWSFYLLMFLIPFRFEFEVADARLNLAELCIALLLARLVVMELLHRVRGGPLPHRWTWLGFIVCGFWAHWITGADVSIIERVWQFFKLVLVFPAAYLIIFYFVHAKAWTQRLIRIFLVGATISALIGIIQTASNGRVLTGNGVHGNLRYLGLFPPYPSDTQIIVRESIGKVTSASYLVGPNVFRAHGGATTHNSLGIILAIALVLAIHEFANPLCRKRVLAGVAIVIQSIALLLTFSRSSWAAVIIALAASVFLHVKRRGVLPRVILAAGVILLLSAILFPLAPTHIRDRIASLLAPQKETSFQSRLDVWNRSLVAISAKPWLGHGTIGVAGTSMRGQVVSSHNSLLAIAHERGIFGLIFFLVFLIRTLCTAFRIFRAQRQKSLGVDSLQGGLFVALMAFCIDGMFNSAILRPDSAILFWFLAGLIAKVAAMVQKDIAEAPLRLGKALYAEDIVR
jgi:hypothetical protein